jgi:F-type H+-transporting ATPase subunit b
MRIDWWTLALQTANVLVLVWLLARFLFRPVAEIVARRQDEANKLLADAATVQRRADEARADLESARANIAAERDKVIAEAHTAAGAEHAALLTHTKEEVEKLRAEADAAIDRDRAAMEKTLIDRTRELSVEIARRLVGRVTPATDVGLFLPGLCRQVQALSPQERAVFRPVPGERDAMAIVTAAALGPEEAERIRDAIGEAFGSTPAVVFRSDPAVIAGIEVHSRHAVIRNSWRGDLDRIREELSHVDEPAKQSR